MKKLNTKIQTKKTTYRNLKHSDVKNVFSIFNKNYFCINKLQLFDNLISQKKITENNTAHYCLMRAFVVRCFDMIKCLQIGFKELYCNGADPL